MLLNEQFDEIFFNKLSTILILQNVGKLVSSVVFCGKYYTEFRYSKAKVKTRHTSLSVCIFGRFVRCIFSEHWKDVARTKRMHVTPTVAQGVSTWHTHATSRGKQLRATYIV